MIQIEIMISGRTKKFVAGGVSLGTSIEAYDLLNEYSQAGGAPSHELLDRCGDFVCRCFGGAFTREQLETGYKGSAFVLYPSMLNAVVGYVHEQIINFPRPAEAPET